MGMFIIKVIIELYGDAIYEENDKRLVWSIFKCP